MGDRIKAAGLLRDPLSIGVGLAAFRETHFVRSMLVCDYVANSAYRHQLARVVSWLVKRTLDARVYLVHYDTIAQLVVDDIAVRFVALRFMRPTS